MTRILVIEAETGARLALRAMLADAGYDVEVAGDGIQGANLYMSRPADLIIADDGQPADFHGGNILAVPGGLMAREAAERLLASGAQAILPKPFSRADLLAAVRQTLQAPEI